MYILIGCSAVAASLSYFAQSVIASDKNWYEQTLQREKYEQADRFKKVWKWMKLNQIGLQIILLWVLWVVVLTVFSCVTIEWDVGQGIYFVLLL